MLHCVVICIVIGSHVSAQLSMESKGQESGTWAPALPWLLFLGHGAWTSSSEVHYHVYIYIYIYIFFFFVKSGIRLGGCFQFWRIFFFYFEPFLLFPGLPSSSDGKESTCNARDLGLSPRSGTSLGEGNGNPLQYSCLENFMERPWGHKELDTTEWLTFTLPFPPSV